LPFVRCTAPLCRPFFVASLPFFPLIMCRTVFVRPSLRPEFSGCASDRGTLGTSFWIGVSSFPPPCLFLEGAVEATFSRSFHSARSLMPLPALLSALVLSRRFYRHTPSLVLPTHPRLSVCFPFSSDDPFISLPVPFPRMFAIVGDWVMVVVSPPPFFLFPTALDDGCQVRLCLFFRAILSPFVSTLTLYTAAS